MFLFKKSGLQCTEIGNRISMLGHDKVEVDDAGGEQVGGCGPPCIKIGLRYLVPRLYFKITTRISYKLR